MLIQGKADRHAKEMAERKTGPQQQREWLLKQLEEDKATRKDRYGHTWAGNSLQRCLPVNIAWRY